MLITTPDMAVHRYNQQQSMSVNDNILQQEVACSKLSKWLALDLEDQNPSLHSVSSLIHSSVNGVKSDISSVFDSNTNTTENSISSDEYFMMRTDRINGQHAATRQWNVNANPFRPVSITSMHQNTPFLPNPTVPPPAINTDFYNNMRMEQHGANIDVLNTPQSVELPNNNNIFAQPPPARYPPIMQQQQPPFQSQEQQQFQNCFDMTDNNMVWQDPNTEFRRWQQYTGTSAWGDPEAQKAVEPIQHWQQFTNDDCMEIIEHLNKINSTTFNAGRKDNNIGWGELPRITSGTYGRIQYLQNSGDMAPPPPPINNSHRGTRMPGVRGVMDQHSNNNNNVAFAPHIANANGGILGGMGRKPPPVGIGYHHHQQPPPTPKWSNLDAPFLLPPLTLNYPTNPTQLLPTYTKLL